jgi:hypothetical protein
VLEPSAAPHDDHGDHGHGDDGGHGLPVIDGAPSTARALLAGESN